MSYESPIEILQKQVTYEMEENVMRAVQSYGINVNKDELIKALMYDRQQYQKGYEDGCRAINISIYDRYTVKHTYTYSYSSFDYDDLQTRTETEECEMNGGEFLQNVVAKSLQDREFSSIVFRENAVCISFFDPTSGHTSDHIYELQPKPMEDK